MNKLRAFLLRDFVRQVVGRPRFQLRHGTRSSTAASASSGSPRASLATRLPACSAASSSRRSGRPPPTEPGSVRRPASMRALYVDECQNFLHLPRDPSRRCWPRPVATGCRWCSPTSTSPSCPEELREAVSLERPHQGLVLHEPRGRPRPRPPRRPRRLTSTTWPTSAPTRPRPVSSSTARRPRPSRLRTRPAPTGSAERGRAGAPGRPVRPRPGRRSHAGRATGRGRPRRDECQPMILRSFQGSSRRSSGGSFRGSRSDATPPLGGEPADRPARRGVVASTADKGGKGRYKSR